LWTLSASTITPPIHSATAARFDVVGTAANACGVTAGVRRARRSAAGDARAGLLTWGPDSAQRTPRLRMPLTSITPAPRDETGLPAVVISQKYGFDNCHRYDDASPRVVLDRNRDHNILDDCLYGALTLSAAIFSVQPASADTTNPPTPSWPECLKATR